MRRSKNKVCTLDCARWRGDLFTPVRPSPCTLCSLFAVRSSDRHCCNENNTNEGTSFCGVPGHRDCRKCNEGVSKLLVLWEAYGEWKLELVTHCKHSKFSTPKANLTQWPNLMGPTFPNTYETKGMCLATKWYPMCPSMKQMKATKEKLKKVQHFQWIVDWRC